MAFASRRSGRRVRTHKGSVTLDEVLSKGKLGKKRGNLIATQLGGGATGGDLTQSRKGAEAPSGRAATIGDLTPGHEGAGAGISQFFRSATTPRR